MCIRKNILSALAYFDMFNYPLKRGEIVIFLPHNGRLSEFDHALDMLVKHLAIFQIGEFFSLRNEPGLADRRRTGSSKAVAMLKKSKRAAALISVFPFVRGVAVSGSLSKKFADESADIDFFIITAQNRLWLSRTFLHLFKKLTYLFGLQHHYCMNYFIDEAQPTILEKNIYTATEVATLIPLYGRSCFERFFNANTWAKRFLPNHRMPFDAREIKRHLFRQVIETVLHNRFGDALDSMLMRWTERSWAAKSRRNAQTSKGIPMRLHTGKHFAKPHPSGFQERLLQDFASRLAAIHERLEPSAPERAGSL